MHRSKLGSSSTVYVKPDMTRSLLQYRPKKLDKLILHQDIGDNLSKLVSGANGQSRWEMLVSKCV